MNTALAKSKERHSEHKRSYGNVGQHKTQRTRKTESAMSQTKTSKKEMQTQITQVCPEVMAKQEATWTTDARAKGVPNSGKKKNFIERPREARGRQKKEYREQTAACRTRRPRLRKAWDAWQRVVLLAKNATRLHDQRSETLMPATK